MALRNILKPQIKSIFYMPTDNYISKKLPLEGVFYLNSPKMPAIPAMTMMQTPIISIYLIILFFFLKEL